MAVPSPTSIRADRPNRRLEIEWPDERVDRIAFHTLRCDCPCAACVSELTGERLLDAATVPGTIDLVAAELAGNYALRIRWSDGHETGLYTWTHLKRLGEQSA